MLESWSKLSKREQRLAALTSALVVVVLTGLLLLGARNRLNALDAEISRTEQDILNLQYQIAQQETVDEAYASVLDEHSTALTQEEIHDNLRREINRLALKDPQAAGLDDGSRTFHPNDYLVWIPELREGELFDEDQGYREYRIRFRVPRTNMLAMLAFLSRLRESRQLLRVDYLELTRAHEGGVVAVELGVTRTVLENPLGPGGEELRGAQSSRRNGLLIGFADA